MNLVGEIYKKNLLESEKNIKFWEEYLHNLTALDFNVFSDKLTVPVLVPIGNKILFRGSLIHTNEVTAALGANYFTKCSIKQAEVLRQHRIQDAKSKLQMFTKEKDYLESQISFSQGIMDGNKGHDIVEVCTDEEDRAWREKHKEKVKQYYQNKKKMEVKSEVIDEDLWSRLDELELQEELENDHTQIDKEDLDDDQKSEYDSFIIKEDDVSNIQTEEHDHDGQEMARIVHYIPKHTSKLDLLQQVIDRQKMLEEKLSELKNRERVQSTTESDLLSRLDEIEQLDELEEEMDRLDEIIQEDDENVSINDEENSIKLTRSVSFADQDESKTLEITFNHTTMGQCKQSYNPEIGIIKPSDIYEAYSTFFANETTSILKKSKHNNVAFDNFYEVKKSTVVPQHVNYADDNKTIIVKDITEKTDSNENNIQSESRPTSLFKKKRLQQKS